MQALAVTTETMDPKDFLLSVATKAAKNTGSSVADVFRRTKSQSYLLGRLKKKYPTSDVEELRSLVTATRWEAMDDPALHEVFVRPKRPPVKGREPIESCKWDQRIKQLRDMVWDDPLTTEDLIHRAKTSLGWTQNFFTSVMAAADGRGILEYQHPYWRPAAKYRRMRETTLAMIARAQARDHQERQHGEKQDQDEAGQTPN